MTLQEMIKALNKLKITQYRIACDTGITRDVIRKYANGCKPNMANLNSVAAVKKIEEYYKKSIKEPKK